MARQRAWVTLLRECLPDCPKGFTVMVLFDKAGSRLHVCPGSVRRHGGRITAAPRLFRDSPKIMFFSNREPRGVRGISGQIWILLVLVWFEKSRPAFSIMWLLYLLKLGERTNREERKSSVDVDFFFFKLWFISDECLFGLFMPANWEVLI